MSIARLRVLAATAVLVALPVGSGAQTPGRFKMSEIFSPAAVSGGGNFHVVANEGDPAQQSLVYTNVKGSTWAKVEVLTRYSSAAAVAYDADGLHVFVINPAGYLQHRLRSPAGVWSGWTVAAGGSNMRGRPAAAVFNNRIYVFVTGGDGKIWYATGTKETYGGFTQFDDMATMESPSAMSDSKRMIVVSINPATGYPRMHVMTGTAWDSRLYGLYIDPANAPLGSLIAAPGPTNETITLTSVTPVPANNVMVSEIQWTSARVPTEYGPSYSLEAFIVGPPAMARGLAGNLTMVVRGTDKQLWIRELVDGNWGGFAKVVAPR